MANNNHGLGRGLASLIPPKNKSAFAKASADKPTGNAGAPQNINQEIAVPVGKAVQDDFLEVPTEKIATNPQQPRHNFDEKELQDLADSIKEHGII